MIVLGGCLVRVSVRTLSQQRVRRVCFPVSERTIDQILVRGSALNSSSGCCAGSRYSVVMKVLDSLTQNVMPSNLF